LKNPDILAKWEDAVKNYDRHGNKKKPNQFSHICRKHFLPTDFTKFNQQQSTVRYRLNFNAIPSIFHDETDESTAPLPFPANQQHGVQVPPLSSEVTIFQTDESTAPLQFPANQHHSVQLVQVPASNLSSEVTILHSTASLPFQSPPVCSEVSLDESTISSDEQNLTSTHHVNFLIPPHKKTRSNDHGEGLDKMKKEILKKDKKIKQLQQKLRRRNSTIQSMKHIICKLKNKSLINKSLEEELHKKFDGVKLAVLKNVLNNSKGSSRSRRYSSTIKEFALTLNFYSPKAYTYVRSIIPLPHPSLIRKWASNINCEPGFLGESFHILEEEAKLDVEKRDCCLVLDAMAIRKQVLWEPSNNKYSGFVDYGHSLEAPEVIASEALVFLLVGLRSHWKQPIGYFLTDKASAVTQSSLINTALTKASAAGLKVWCVTSDGTSTNISTYKILGCTFGDSYDSISTKFKHPVTGEDVFVILDACHMLKLARNALAFLGTICTPDGEKIEWKFFNSLHLVQEQEGLKLGNKLSNNHVQYEKHKMNVSLAAQTLSGSVADAVDFMNTVLKLPEFRESEATVLFIRIIDRLFDLLNSRNPHGKNFKKPLTLTDMSGWQATLQSTAKYLLSLKSLEGVPIVKHPRRTFVLGFVITIKFTLEMVKQMLIQPEDPFRYVLTYKYSQDHIELLFSCIRAKGGWNNNPNSLQLKYAFRRMLLGNAVTASAGANCQMFDDNMVIPIFRTRKHVSPLAKESPEDSDKQQPDHHLNRMVTNLEDCNGYSEFVQNILHYISGYIVSKLVKQVKCSLCISNLTGSSPIPTQTHHNYSKPSHPLTETELSFLQFTNNGNLKIPSKFVMDVIKYAEHIFKLYVINQPNQINTKKNLKTKMILELCQHFGDVATKLLPPQHEISINEPLLEEDHRLWLLKCVADSYLTLRLFTYGKHYGETVINFGKPSQRHHLTKMILFNNQ
jgi:hypothetical protein